MKKVLFGSTALVAAAGFAGFAAANDLELSIEGGLTTGVGVGAFTDGDYKGSATSDVRKDFHIINEGEIQFKAKGTLDNGITVTARIELESYDAGNVMDESWVAVSSSFGTIKVGNDDNAADIIAGGIGRLGTAVALGAHDGSYEFVPASVDQVLGGSDNFSVQYYTPNIAGFSAGISWAPNTSGDADAIDTNLDIENSNDEIGVGVSYSQAFGEVDFTIGGGYVTRDANPDGGEEFTTTAWAAGAEVGFGGFTIAGRYGYSETETAAGDDETTTYGGGIVYATGPWEFGVTAAIEEYDAVAVGDDTEELRVNAGVTYELGDGVDLGLGVDYGETEYTDSTEEDVDGFGGALLLGVAF